MSHGHQVLEHVYISNLLLEFQGEISSIHDQLRHSRTKWLSENVSIIVFTGPTIHLYDSVFDLILDKVNLDINVLGTS